MITAPIALFVYNRPDHVRLTVDALLKNELAGESDLFIFSDAPKTSEDFSAVRGVRDYIKTITGFRSVTIIEREKNLGLAASIISGVTKVCGEYGRVIVLEDDMVTSPYFLRYINDALDLYANEERVISIHGYSYPVKGILPETFFLRGADCWGWGTWKRGWDLFEPDGRKLLDGLRKGRNEHKFNFGGSHDYIGMLEGQIRGKNNSWAIRWYASAFLKDKLTLYPGRSLVNNIGNDASGTHCDSTNAFSVKTADSPIVVGEIPVEGSDDAVNAFAVFFRSLRPSISSRVAGAIRNVAQRGWSLIR